MEKTNEPIEVKGIVGSYQLTVINFNNKLRFRAYSETLGKLFEEEFTNETLPANLKEQYEDCLVIYELVGDAVASQQVVLNDNGELRFSFKLMMGKIEKRKEILVMLK
jgi:hypothetical protein